MSRIIPIEKRFWAKVIKSDGCWLWSASKSRKGYGQISTKRGSNPMQTHRLSWELHFGAVPDGLCVLHHCDNPSCVRPDHLFLGTIADNDRDRDEKGRTVKGDDHVFAILTADLVTVCRRRYWIEGASTDEIASEMGVSRGALDQSVRGKTWRHVPFDDECRAMMDALKGIHPAQRGDARKQLQEALSW